MRPRPCRLDASVSAAALLCHVFVVGALVTLVVGRTASAAAAQKDGAEPPETAKSQDAPADSPKAGDGALEEWKRLDERRREIAQELRRLRDEYNRATDRVTRRTLEVRFNTLLEEWEQKVEPQMVASALAALKADPANAQAAEMALESNDYEAVVEAGEKLLADGKRTAPLVNLLAQAQFNLHHFERAKELFDAAEKDGQLSDLSRQYAEVVDEYITAWQAEQELREAEAALPEEKQLPRVKFVVERQKDGRGEILIELFEDQAPNTVANFVSLVEQDKYDGTKFHRVIGNFMAQGGDPNTLDADPANDGQGGPGYSIECECYREDARKHFRGSLSMAHSGRDTGGSQFFLTHRPTFHLNGRHTVFGRVVEGQDVVDSLRKGDKLVEATVTRKRDHEYDPVTSAEREKDAAPKKEPGE